MAFLSADRHHFRGQMGNPPTFQADEVAPHPGTQLRKVHLLSDPRLNTVPVPASLPPTMPLSPSDPATIRPQLTSSPSTASTFIRQFLSRTRPTEPDQPEDDRLIKRRATNRKSQQKSRENKDALIKQLQEENERLRREVDALGTPQTRGALTGGAGKDGALPANDSLSG